MRKKCTLEWVDDNGNVIPNGITPIKAEPYKSTDQNVADVPIGDTISRADAIEVGNKIVEELALSSLDWDDLKCWTKELFDALPSADRPKGEWIEYKNFNGELKTSECSNCKHPQGYKTPYCCECGADMRGDVM